MAFTLWGFPLIEGLLLIALGVSSACYLIGLYSGYEFFRRRPPATPSRGKAPGVSVLKPLKGVDVGLYENLVSLCRQDYPGFQLIFGVADPDDPAISIVRRVQREHPGVAIELVIDGRVYGTNYKVSNLYNMYRRAKHDIIVIADSDIRVRPSYLRHLVAGLQDHRVGLVTCLYRAVNTGGWPTTIEALFINTDFAGLVMLARKVERATYAFGATIAIRREVLEEIGGFLPIANFLADDYQIGYRVALRGYELALSQEVVETVIAVPTWRRLLDHQLRWARTYRISRPGGYFGSILTHGTFWAVVNVLYHQFSPLSCLASLGVLGLRYLYAAALARWWLRSETGLGELLLVAPKDLFITAVWLLAFLGDTVSWSGRRFRVLRNGEMIDVSPTPLPAAKEWPAEREVAEETGRTAARPVLERS